MVVLLILSLNFVIDHGEASSPMKAQYGSPWYCHRLVPAQITSSVTPCTFPCLFLSAHEDPRIVVHHEPDGTSCKISTGLHHQFEVGVCRGSFCISNSGQRKLKRKKRFICLLSLIKLIKAKKEMKALNAEISRLRSAAVARRSGTLSPRGGGIVDASRGTRLPNTEVGRSGIGSPGVAIPTVGSIGSLGAGERGSSARRRAVSENANSINLNAGHSGSVGGFGSGFDENGGSGLHESGIGGDEVGSTLRGVFSGSSPRDLNIESLGREENFSGNAGSGNRMRDIFEGRGISGVGNNGRGSTNDLEIETSNDRRFSVDSTDTENGPSLARLERSM